FTLIRPLVPVEGRLRLISYLDFPVRDEFDREIRTWIHLSNGVLAILDHRALNVIYEIGVAIGLGKPVILLAPSLDDVPSMLRAKNVILFQTQSETSAQLRTKISQTVKAVLQGNFLDQRFQDHTAVLLNNLETIGKEAMDAPDPLVHVADADDLEL